VQHCWRVQSSGAKRRCHQRSNSRQHEDTGTFGHGCGWIEAEVIEGRANVQNFAPFLRCRVRSFLVCGSRLRRTPRAQWFHAAASIHVLDISLGCMPLGRAAAAICGIDMSCMERRGLAALQRYHNPAHNAGIQEQSGSCCAWLSSHWHIGWKIWGSKKEFPGISEACSLVATNSISVEKSEDHKLKFGIQEAAVPCGHQCHIGWKIWGSQIEIWNSRSCCAWLPHIMHSALLAREISAQIGVR
jgi:hypothetical protein